MPLGGEPSMYSLCRSWVRNGAASALPAAAAIEVRHWHRRRCVHCQWSGRGRRQAWPERDPGGHVAVHGSARSDRAASRKVALTRRSHHPTAGGRHPLPQAPCLAALSFGKPHLRPHGRRGTSRCSSPAPFTVRADTCCGQRAFRHGGGANARGREARRQRGPCA